jgi:immunity protein, SdpI family
LLLLPLIALGIYLLLLLLPRIDPRRANYARFQGAYLAIRAATLVFLALLYGFVLLWIKEIQLEVSAVVPTLVGMLFIMIGFFMGRIQPNWFVGIRTPWTLSSGLSWRKTHRLGGWVFALMGLIFVASGLADSTTAFMVALTIFIGGVLLLVVYSYLMWRVDPQRSSR